MLDLSQLAGRTFAGRYHVTRLIRAGGMGAVYEAVHSGTHRRVALKLMRPELVQDDAQRARFVREAQVASVIESPHVVDVLDAGVLEGVEAGAREGVPYLVMELLVGEELGDRLARVGRLSPQEVMAHLTHVARALDKAHDRGVVHRNLKPENLFVVMRDGEPPLVKVLDFGIAKLLQTAGSGGTTKSTGTPLYMAPEQSAVASHVSSATDVWALGLIAYTLLVGRTYWQGGTVHQVFAEVLTAPMERPTSRAARLGVALPPAFDDWFFRCVERDASRRTQRAGEAIATLGDVFGIGARPPTPRAIQAPAYAPAPTPAFAPAPALAPFSSAPPPPARFPVIALVACALVAVGVILAVVFALTGGGS